MQPHPAFLLLLFALLSDASADFRHANPEETHKKNSGSVAKALQSSPQIGLGVNVESTKIGLRHDDGNPYYYLECSAGVDIKSGLVAGCERKWKPVFYVLIATGALLAALLLSGCCCCCCCCCASCRKNSRPAYMPAPLQTTSHVIVVNPEVAKSHGYATSTYAAPKLSA